MIISFLRDGKMGNIEGGDKKQGRGGSFFHHYDLYNVKQKWINKQTKVLRARQLDSAPTSQMHHST